MGFLSWSYILELSVIVISGGEEEEEEEEEVDY